MHPPSVGRRHLAAGQVRYGLGDVHAPPLPAAARADAGQPAPDHPDRTGWAYEPKWDGFRAIVFRDGADAHPEPRPQAARPLFPGTGRAVARESARRASWSTARSSSGRRRAGFRSVPAAHPPGRVTGGDAGRPTPASYVAWDLLARGRRSARDRPRRRRARLETVLADARPGAPDAIDRTLRRRGLVPRFEGAGLDGVIAKPLAISICPASGR